MEWEEKKNIEFNLQLGSSIFMSYTSIPNFKLTNKNVIKFMTWDWKGMIQQYHILSHLHYGIILPKIVMKLEKFWEKIIIHIMKIIRNIVVVQNYLLFK